MGFFVVTIDERQTLSLQSPGRLPIPAGVGEIASTGATLLLLQLLFGSPRCYENRIALVRIVNLAWTKHHH